MRFMVEHVVQQGAQSVWVVEEDLAVPSVESRIAGFEQGVVDAGIEMNSGKKIRIPTRRVHSLAQPWQAEESYAMGRSEERRVGKVCRAGRAGEEDEEKEAGDN